MHAPPAAKEDGYLKHAPSLTLQRDERTHAALSTSRVSAGRWTAWSRAFSTSRTSPSTTSKSTAPPNRPMRSTSTRGPMMRRSSSRMSPWTTATSKTFACYGTFRTPGFPIRHSETSTTRSTPTMRGSRIAPSTDSPGTGLKTGSSPSPGSWATRAPRISAYGWSKKRGSCCYRRAFTRMAIKHVRIGFAVFGPCSYHKSVHGRGRHLRPNRRTVKEDGAKGVAEGMSR